MGPENENVRKDSCSVSFAYQEYGSKRFNYFLVLFGAICAYFILNNATASS
jgi:hypothetical protein